MASLSPQFCSNGQTTAFEISTATTRKDALLSYLLRDDVTVNFQKGRVQMLYKMHLLVVVSLHVYKLVFVFKCY